MIVMSGSSAIALIVFLLSIVPITCQCGFPAHVTVHDVLVDVVLDVALCDAFTVADGDGETLFGGWVELCAAVHAHGSSVFAALDDCGDPGDGEAREFGGTHVSVPFRVM